MSLPKKVFDAVAEHDYLNQRIMDSDEGTNSHRIHRVRDLIEGIALFFAGYKCENPKCRSEQFLQLHHFVNRGNRGSVRFAKYSRSRHNYRNVAVLCIKCHAEVEGRTNLRDIVEKKYFMSVDKIQEVREFYGENPNAP